MAICVELTGRQLTKGQSPSGRLKYQVWADAGESIDQAVAYGQVLAVSPATYEGLFKQNVNVEEVSDEIYAGQVQYGTLGKKDPGDDPGWSFELGGATHRLTHSLETVQSYGVGDETPPDFQNGINVRRSGNGGDTIDGVDVDVDAFTWEETQIGRAHV